MPKPTKTIILDDLPTDTDALDFQPYVDTLVDIVENGNTPLTIGVFGTWGSGKTSLMRMVKKGLPEEFTIAWFDAWKYDKEETLWRAFLLSVLLAIEEKVQARGEPPDALEKLKEMLYRAIDIEKAGGVTIDLARLGGKLAQGAVQIGLSFIPGGAVLSEFVKKLQELGAETLTDDVTEAIQRERTKIHIEQVRFLEQFQEKFRELVDAYVVKAGGRLVVFVDDLDRCLPEKAIEVLEAIKLFVDAPGCVFLLGLDQKVIERGVEVRYKDFNKAGEGQDASPIAGAHYLEKIIQLPFLIPPVEQADMGDFVQGLASEWPDAECPGVFAAGLGYNPRQIKRTVNVFLMLWRLAEKRQRKLEGRIKPIRLAKVVAIQTIYPELYSLLKETPRYLRELEEYYRSEEKAEGGEMERPESHKSAAVVEKSARAEPAPALAPYISRQAVRRILTMHPPGKLEANFSGLAPDELRLYFTLTRRAEALPPSTAGPAGNVFEPQMIKIPAGAFRMGTTPEQARRVVKEGGKDWEKYVQDEQPQHLVELSEYAIGKYPVTNREYQFFVKETGHRFPQGWDEGQYPAEKGDHPVVNVSWEDARDYCQWLSSKTGRNYHLPSEAEWEKAARWHPAASGRGQGESLIYPWGDDFDPKKCNMADSGIRATSPVGQFSPQGDSPYGCADMAGNVWEWCADWFKEDEYKGRQDGIKDPTGPEKGQYRVLRGGSWDFNRNYARCAYRFRYVPDYFYNSLGFRLVLGVPKLMGQRSL
jgi:formylglycine-generating enzyme required for sulfatase activity